MFHKNVSNSLRSISIPPNAAQELQQTSSFGSTLNPRLTLVPSGGDSAIGSHGSSPGIRTTQKTSSPMFELLAISAHRCSSFFAEAAVLVLVLALLDRFMLKGRMEINWVLSAFAISLMLLAASIATDFTARRWLKVH